MRKIEYSIGDRYGNRVIIDTAPPRVYKSGSRAEYVKVRCDCGREDEVRLCLLVKGKADMCANCRSRVNAKWGGSAYKAVWYNCWNSMMQRCYNPKYKRFADWGGRGIIVCDDWHNPNNFGKWAEENGFQKGLQIDRINNDGNYEPSNCRFVSATENMRNRRNSIILVISDIAKPLNEWCEKYLLNPDVVRTYHTRKNLSWEDAFFLALGRKTCKEY